MFYRCVMRRLLPEREVRHCVAGDERIERWACPIACGWLSGNNRIGCVDRVEAIDNVNYIYYLYFIFILVKNYEFDK